MALTKVLDVANPSESGSALPGLVPGSGFGVTNSARLQDLLNESITNSPTTAKAIYWPIGIYELASTVTIPSFNSFRMFSLGGICKSLTQMQVHSGSCTYIVWTGGAVGPMFLVDSSDGDVWEGLNLDGSNGPETNAGGAGLDVLVKYTKSGSSGCLYHHWKDCSLMRAQTLYYATGTLGTAEHTFSKIMWNCGESSTTRWTSQAFRSDNPQCVNVVFDSNNEFNNCAYCVHVTNTGRVQINNPTITICGTILYRNGGSQNVLGDMITLPHIDGGNGSEGRKALYKSANPNSTMGPVKIICPKYGSIDDITDEFAEIISFSGNDLNPNQPIRMRVGDRVAFVRKDDRSNVSGGKVETTIATRTNDLVYTTTDTAESLGFVLGVGETIANAYDMCNGESLIECVSSDFVHLDMGYLTHAHIRAGRLARLTHSSFSTGRSPKFVASKTQGYSASEFDAAGMERLLTMSGTCYWRFEDADQVADGAAPLTVGNFGVVTSGSSGDTIVVNEGGNTLMRKYATEVTIRFSLKAPDTGKFKSGVTFEAGDIKIAIDDAVPANATNAASEIGGGAYKITLTAAEVTGKNVRLLIEDQTVPAIFASSEIVIDTTGNASAQHALDIDVASVASNLKAVDDDTDVVARFKRAAGSMVLGTVGSGSSVSTIVTSSLAPNPAVLDGLKNRIVLFHSGTATAALRGVSRDVTGSTAGGSLTVSPSLPTAPASGDLFVIS